MPLPKIAVTAALMVAQIALGAMRKIEGPRLDDLKVSLADYGTPLPRFWGIRRFEGAPIIWAEELREKKKTSKGKSGKYADYRYFGTWAVAVADCPNGPIDAVSRIWLDKHLCFQLTGGGPISVATALGRSAGVENAPVKLANGNNLRIYLGSTTQEPDPRIEEWCEDRYGADSCPAYRGTAYIVFENIPLEKFGNRIPQVTVEAISSKTDAFPGDEYDNDNAGQLQHTHFNRDFSRLYFMGLTGGGTGVWDTATRQFLFSFDYPPSGGSFEHVGFRDDGSFYASRNGTVWLVSPDGARTQVTLSGIASNNAAYAGGLIITWSTAGAAQYVAAGEPVDLGFTFTVSQVFENADGDAVAVGYVPSENKLAFAIYDGFHWTETILATTTTGLAFGLDNGRGQYVFWQQNVLHLIDKDTLTIEDTMAASVASTTQADKPFSYWPGGDSIWLHDSEYSVVDLSLIRSVDLGDWTTVTGGGQSLYDPINHALVSNGSGVIAWHYLGRVGNAGVTLADIVDDVSGWCAVDDTDTSDLDQAVEGYSGTQGPGRDWISPLLDIHDSDARPHDFGVEFIKRGQASGGTLLTEDFVREGGDPAYSVSIAQDTELPRKITFNFADVNGDQQSNNVVAQRHLESVDSTAEQTIDLTTYVLAADDAQKLGDRYLRRIWNSRERPELSLTMQEMALEPGDVQTLSLDGTTRNARLEKMTLVRGDRREEIATEWVRDFGGLNTLASGTAPDMGGRDPEVIFIPGPTKGIVLDIPLVSDADSNANPLLYYAAGKYASPWPGAVVYEVDADGDAEEWAAVDSSEGAVWGYATDALGDANPNLWDRGSSVNIKLFSGTLSSVTEAGVNADPTLNMAYLGGELLNFTTATLEADGTYTLSGFLRGRRGTEGVTSNHAASDEFVLVSSLQNESRGLSEVGTDIDFKVQSLGRDPDGATVIEVDFEGASLKPYAPIIHSVTKDSASGDIEIVIRTRTRIGGSFNGSTIPTGETIAEYEFDVIDGDGDVIRTLESTDKTFTYSAADQTTDFGSEIEANELEGFAYQMSATVGRGFARAA